MHTILNWLVNHLWHVVSLAAIASLSSVVFSAIQVRKKLLEERLRIHEQTELVARELAIATSDTGQKSAAPAAPLEVDSRQKSGGLLGRGDNLRTGGTNAAFGNPSR
jgi:hypothetical protein